MAVALPCSTILKTHSKFLLESCRTAGESTLQHVNLHTRTWTHADFLLLVYGRGFISTLHGHALAFAWQSRSYCRQNKTNQHRHSIDTVFGHVCWHFRSHLVIEFPGKMWIEA